MPLLCALALGQVVATTQSGSLKFDGRTYVPSPIFAIKPITADERYVISSDGTRIAYVSASSTASPGAQTSLIARGKPFEGVIKVGIWSRDTGRAFDVFVPTSNKVGVGDFQFLGRDVVFETFESIAVGNSTYGLWIAREGSTAKPIKLDGYTGGARLIVSRDRSAIVVAGAGKVWLMNASKTLPVHTPGYVSFVGRGLSKEGLAVVWASRANGSADYLLVDFATGKVSIGSENSEVAEVSPKLPFILDTFRLSGQKASGLIDDPRALKVDGQMGRVMSEDGGWRLDLVESEGEKRNRLAFIPDMGVDLRVSPDGLTYVFVSNKMLMTRWMIKLDPEAEKLRKG